MRIDQAEVPDSLDPAVSFSTPGWAAVQQVYQGLVNYNGSSDTTFLPVLAKTWTESYDSVTGFSSYSFSLRGGVHFSNGDPYNAYVQWYSLYRSLLLEQGPQFILEQNFYSTNFSATNPLSYYSNLSAVQAANTTLVSDLNSWDFFSPNPGEIALMELPDQSFQVINNLTIQLNLGYGYLASNYTYLLASISAPTSYAVDPGWVDAHGGIVEGLENPYLSTNTLGTGQYLLSNYHGIVGGGYNLTPDPGYWGSAAARTEPWNSMLPPANTSIDITFQGSTAVTINDLKTGAVAEASFASLDPSTVLQLEGNPCIQVQALPTVYGATSGSWWIYLDQDQYPFSNLSVREAIAHAINYTQVIQQAFGGYGSPWVGPVPPGYPYYDPPGLPAYSYDLTLAKEEIANSPCANNACAGLSFNYEYLDIGTPWASTAQLLKSDLAQIGITIAPVGISLGQLYTEQTINPTTGVCTSATSTNGGPFYIGQEFYTSDYISPDDWSQVDAASFGSANMCMAHYANATMDSLVIDAAAESNPATLTTDYAQMTSMLYQNYSELWLIVPTEFAIYSPFVHGMVQNPMGCAQPSAILFNTQWAKNPPTANNYPVTFTQTGLPGGTDWSVTLSRTTNSSTTPAIGFVAPNGTYPYGIAAIPGYAANPSSGSLTVSGTTVTVAIAFTRIPAGHYSVTFTETGLPTGTTWSVILNGSAQSSLSNGIGFSEPNGSYPYSIPAVSGYLASPSAGSITVAGGAIAQGISFTAIPLGQYVVSFDETGLPTGTAWSVTLNGTSHSSSSATLTFTEPNGSYPFTVGTVAGYRASPASGSTTVSGSAVSVAIAFAAAPPTKYAITFVESGLPSGTTWSVTLNGSGQSSTTSSIVFSESNDTYPYTIGSVSGYSSNVTSGSVPVAGSPKTISIGFTSTTSSGSSSGGLSTTDRVIIGLVIAAAVVAGIVVATRRKRPGTSMPPPPQVTPPPPPSGPA